MLVVAKSLGELTVLVITPYSRICLEITLVTNADKKQGLRRSNARKLHYCSSTLAFCCATCKSVQTALSSSQRTSSSVKTMDIPAIFLNPKIGI